MAWREASPARFSPGRSLCHRRLAVLCPDPHHITCRSLCFGHVQRRQLSSLHDVESTLANKSLVHSKRLFLSTVACSGPPCCTERSTWMTSTPTDIHACAAHHVYEQTGLPPGHVQTRKGSR
ncbi:hypothetical protein IG631_12996 [Alternaria alternata]|nr:hypothetical protein IG631_12996 [Alternaria alternata]